MSRRRTSYQSQEFTMAKKAKKKAKKKASKKTSKKKK